MLSLANEQESMIDRNLKKRNMFVRYIIANTRLPLCRHYQFLK